MTLLNRLIFFEVFNKRLNASLACIRLGELKLLSVSRLRGGFAGFVFLADEEILFELLLSGAVFQLTPVFNALNWLSLRILEQ